MILNLQYYPIYADASDVYKTFNILAQNAYTLLILASLRDYKVGIFLCRLDKLLVHRLQYVKITADNHVDSTSALNNVTLNVAYQTLVRVGVNKYFRSIMSRSFCSIAS